LPTSLPFATGGGARLRQLDSGTDDSDLASTSESESDDQEMESKAEDRSENGDAADVEMVSTSGKASSLGPCMQPVCLRTDCKLCVSLPMPVTEPYMCL